MKIMLTTLLAVSLMVSPHQLPESHIIDNRAFLEHYFGNLITEIEVEIGVIDRSAPESPQYNTQDMKVCSSSSAKTYMDWLKTSATSRQGIFMREHMTVRDGLLYDKDGFIGVALGSYFGGIGDRFIITLDTGIILYLIKVEEKSDAHTINGCQQRWDRSVIEFVIDIRTNKFPYFSNSYIANGNFNNLEQFKGKIIRIQKVLN